MANEKRLIYSDSLFEEASKVKFMGFRAEERKQNFLDMISAMLDNCPTVDAVEVVHGRWEYHDPVSPNCFCSVCHHDAPWDDFADYHSYRTNYCPNCGARMDGGNEDGS